MKKDHDAALSGHHLMALYVFLFLGGESRIWELMFFRYGYGEKRTQHVIKALRKIKRAGTKIKIVNTLDDICKRCEVERPRCSSPKIARANTKIAEYVGLKVGKIHGSKHVLRKLKAVDEKDFLDFYSKC